MSKITSIEARKILNSRADWTIEVAVELDGKYKGIVSMPQGVSTGAFEVHSVDASQAVKNIQEKVADKIRGMKGENQEDLDNALLDIDGTSEKSNIGANAILGISLAAARAVARSRNIAFWEYLRDLYSAPISKERKDGLRVFMNFIEGGVHAGSDLSFQEYLVIPKGKDISEQIAKGARLYKALRKYILEHIGRSSINVGDEGGFAPTISDNVEPLSLMREVADKEGLYDDIEFGIDIAANNVNMEAGELFEIYRKIKRDFPLIYLEDPFKEDDFDNFAQLLKEFDGNVMITGDDLTTTNPIRMGLAARTNSINSVIIKPNQIGTLTETLRAVHSARSHNWYIVCSHRGGETNDDFIVDLAYAIGADGIKIGGPARGERIAKYNRLLEIAS